jgi:rubrerythrin
MAREAKQEGFDEIARVFEGIGRIEKEHRERYKKLLDNLKSKRVFQRSEKVQWRCRNCGFTVDAVAAPPQCPVCKHPQAYFEIAPANF